MTKEEKVIDILDKWEFFFGQRAGRELWAHKPIEVQNQDISDFNRDVQLVRSALSEQPRWISVEERLPDESMYGKEFIVAIKNRFNESCTATMLWWGENQRAKVWTVWHDVTHWMPLPEPPEVEV